MIIRIQERVYGLPHSTIRLYDETRFPNLLLRRFGEIPRTHWTRLLATAQVFRAGGAAFRFGIKWLHQRQLTLVSGSRVVVLDLFAAYYALLLACRP